MANPLTQHLRDRADEGHYLEPLQDGPAWAELAEEIEKQERARSNRSKRLAPALLSSAFLVLVVVPVLRMAWGF